MDVTQAKTFLMVVQLRNFNLAAEKLFVTQSTVSTRIKVLEDKLGCTLFIRNKSGVTLTPAAKRFERHAQSMVHLWTHAKHEVMLEEEIDHSITIGARFGLWEPLLLDWLIDVRSDFPQTQLKIKISTANSLMQDMHNGIMDFCIVYSPYSNVGLKPLKLFNERFVMVSAKPLKCSTLPKNYIFVDWGSEFSQKHTLHFPEGQKSLISANLGVLAKSLILKINASGYLPLRLVKQDIEEKKLYIIEGMPVLSIPVYAVYSEFLDKGLRTILLNSLMNNCIHLRRSQVQN